MSDKALQYKIKTEMTTYLGKEVDGVFPSDGKLYPMRFSDNGVTGETDTIEDDTLLPESRVKAIPETGTSKNAGDLKTKWNVDEQDALLAAVMCGEWTNAVISQEEQEAGVTSKKELVLGEAVHQFTMVNKWPQAPVEYQVLTHEQINSLTIAFALKSLVSMTWNLMGSNNPPKVTENPFPNAEIQDALTTRAMKTLDGAIQIGMSIGSLVKNRQIDDMNVSINNNKESTDALYEPEAVEQSDGDFQVTGDFRVLNSGAVARELYNASLAGEKRYIKISNWRQDDITGIKTQYDLLLHVHLDKATSSKDGNKFKYQVTWTMDGADGIKFTKLVYGEPAPEAATPVFENELQDVSYTVGDEASELDGTATVSDEGTLTYSWEDGSGNVVATTATFTPPTDTEGTVSYTVTATNTLGESTADASQTVTVTVSDQ